MKAETKAKRRVTHFRDLTVAAPLKLFRPLDSLRHQRHFRDLTVAAPLKPAVSTAGLGAWGNFRDLTVAAPLKRREKSLEPILREGISAT